MGEYLPAGRVPRNAALVALVGCRVKRGPRGRGRPRNPDDIRQLKISDLRSKLKTIGLETTGRKADLVARLEAALEADSEERFLRFQRSIKCLSDVNCDQLGVLSLKTQ